MISRHIITSPGPWDLTSDSALPWTSSKYTIKVQLSIPLPIQLIVTHTVISCKGKVVSVLN